VADHDAYRAIQEPLQAATVAERAERAVEKMVQASGHL
jgi:hypothetical protein